MNQILSPSPNHNRKSLTLSPNKRVKPAVALVETGDSLLSTAPVVPGSESTSVPVPLSSVVSKPSSVSASQPPATPIVSTLAEDMSPPLIAEVSPTATMREHQLESPAVLPSKPPSLPPTPTAAPAAAPIAAPPVALPAPPAVAPTGSKPSSAPAKVKPVATAPVRVLKGQLSAAMRDLDVMHGVFRGGNSNVAPSFGVFGKRVEPDFDAVKLPSSEAAARDARKHKKKKHKPRTILGEPSSASCVFVRHPLCCVSRRRREGASRKGEPLQGECEAAGSHLQTLQSC